MNGLPTADFVKLKNKENLTTARELKDFLQKDRKLKQARLFADQQALILDASNDKDVTAVQNGGIQCQSGQCQNGNRNPSNNATAVKTATTATMAMEIVDNTTNTGKHLTMAIAT